MSSAAESSFLHYEWIHNNEDASSRIAHPPIVFLHGLLGNSRNIMTMAKKMCAIKQTRGLLVDITGHGRSAGRQTTHDDKTGAITMDDAVQDFQQTLSCALMDEDSHDLTIVGHSLGGRLALQYAANINVDNAAQQHRPSTIWLLDTVPDHADDTVVHVLNTANIVLDEHHEITGHRQLERVLMDEYGTDRRKAAWLASQYNVKSNKFRFDVDTAISLAADIERQNFWELIDRALDADVVIHIVQASENKAWESCLPELQTYVKQNDMLYHHVLPNAGHWVHIDNLEGLLEIFEQPIITRK
jgi:pimeloyl-ACP methyl ester carboxylesterase